MASTAKLPTIADFLDAYQQAVRGQRDPLANAHRRGSGYEVAGGGSAMLWAQQVERARFVFAQIYTEGATGEALNRRVKQVYGVERIVRARGQGTAVFQRAAPGAAGTIYAGSRVEVHRISGSTPSAYAVASDVTVGAGETVLAVPMQAIRLGAGVAITESSPSRLRLVDSLFDSFTVTSLTCADGTDLESAADYIARARRERRKARLGIRSAIERVCLEAGASYVVALDSATFGPSSDVGVHFVYVADASFTSTQALRDACMLALDSARVAGGPIQVLGMTPTPITSCTAVVSLVVAPSKVNTLALKTAITSTLLDEFSIRPNFWTFKLAALAGAIGRVSPLVQVAGVTTTPGEPAATFAASLPRYTLAGNAIHVTFTGPT